MIKIAICDDEYVFIEDLQNLLKRYAEERGLDIHVINYKNGADLIERYNMQIDLIFLDIKMDVMNGLEAADKIRKIDSLVSIIFLTSLTKYVLEGYKYQATNYIIKPMKYVRLKSEMDNWIAKRKQTEEDFILVNNDTGIYKIILSELNYIETFNRNLMIHTNNENIISYKKIKDFEDELCNKGFVRCHSGYIINLSYIKRTEKLEFELLNGKRIPISQPKRKAVMEKLAEYWGDRL